MAETAPPEEKEEILERVEQRAASYMYEFKGCGQAVLLALQKEFNLPVDSEVYKAATFTAAGMARMGDICGLLCGGMMALGLVSGRKYPDDTVYPEPQLIDQATGLPKSLVTLRSFYQKAMEVLGGSTCRDVQLKMCGRTFDLGIPKEWDEFSELIGTKCSELAGQVARLAAETILEMPRR